MDGRNYGLEISGKVAELIKLLSEARQSMPDNLVETVFEILLSKPLEQWTDIERKAAKIIEFDRILELKKRGNRG